MGPEAAEGLDRHRMGGRMSDHDHHDPLCAAAHRRRADTVACSGPVDLYPLESDSDAFVFLCAGHAARSWGIDRTPAPVEPPA